jgi:hypothetical protein
MLSPEHRKAIKIAAVVLFNVATVWWLTKELKVDLRHVVAWHHFLPFICGVSGRQKDGWHVQFCYRCFGLPFMASGMK